MAFEDRIRLPALNLIHRRLRLLNLVNEFMETGQRLITVYAPSGYGKSILLADFAQTTDLPVCWCSLDTTDRDPAAFLTLLAYSITDRFHEIELQSLIHVIERGDTPSSVRRIAEVLQPMGPHVIIIDDYHKANSAGVTLALSRLLDQLPESSRLIVAARGDVAIETRQVLDLLLAERAAGLSENELRFTPEELQLLMRKRFGRQIDLEGATEIARVTDGNIAQILLTGHLMHAERLINRLAQRLGNDRGIIYNYLADEVLSKQPPHLQRFMLCTSMLPDMTAELCNELLEIQDAQAHIEELVRRDLFVTQIGASFRYHDLFAEFLRSRLADDPAERRPITIRAARLLAERGRYEHAVPLLLDVEAWNEAAEVLESEGRYFYDTGRALTLNDWLSRIPEAELQQHPRLLLWWARILSEDISDPKLGTVFAKEAEQRFLAENDHIGAAEAMVVQAVALRLMGRASDSLALASAAIERLESLQADHQIMALAIRNRGLAYATGGYAAEAMTDLRRALTLYEQLNDTHRIGLCHHDIGICLCQLGNVAAAEHHFRQAIRIWELLDNANNLSNTLNSLAVSLHTVGRYGDALEQFRESLDVARQVGATRRAAFAQAGIGDVYLARHQYDAAVEAFRMSTELADQAGVQPLEVYNLVRMGEALYWQGALGASLRLASRAREIAAEIGLIYQKGLACALQARICVRQAQYETSFDLFRQALECFTHNDVLELARVHLWWGHSLLQDMRARAALEHLEEAIQLALTMGELTAGLGPTVAETRQLLVHALQRADVTPGMRDSIALLLHLDRAEAPEATRSLQVFLFGPPALAVAGERKQFSQRGRVRRMPEFLAYLLLKGQEGGCRWNEVSDAIWPELDTERASISFHQTIKRLRDSVFGDYDYVMVQDDYYQINPRYLDWCDAVAFERLYDRATRLPSERALPLWLEIVHLYAGEFLAGFEVGEWGLAQRALYETRFLQCVKLAGDALIQQGAAQVALGVINRGLAVDYFSEDLHHSAMAALAQLGLYDRLEAHYEEMCQRFEDELGAAPESVTLDLLRHVMEGRSRRTG